MGRGEGGEQQSQAYYILKAAQQKEELQKRSEELDMQLKVGEKELREMENSLAYLQNSNQRYGQALKKNLKAASLSPGVEDIRGAEDEIKLLNDTLHAKNKDLAELERIDLIPQLESAEKRIEVSKSKYEQLQAISRGMAADVAANASKLSLSKINNLPADTAGAQVQVLTAAQDALLELSKADPTLETFVRNSLRN